MFPHVSIMSVFLYIFSLFGLVILWALFLYGGYRISQFEKEFVEYDPYHVLEIDRVRLIL